MAKPIGDTPVLYGKEAAEFINTMFEPPTKEEKEFKKKLEKVRRVPF